MLLRNHLRGTSLDWTRFLKSLKKSLISKDRKLWFIVTKARSMIEEEFLQVCAASFLHRHCTVSDVCILRNETRRDEKRICSAWNLLRNFDSYILKIQFFGSGKKWKIFNNFNIQSQCCWFKRRSIYHISVHFEWCKKSILTTTCRLIHALLSWSLRCDMGKYFQSVIYQTALSQIMERGDCAVTWQEEVACSTWVIFAH